MEIRADRLHVVGIDVGARAEGVEKASTACRLALTLICTLFLTILVYRGTWEFSRREEPEILAFISIDSPLPSLNELLLQVLLRLVLMSLPIELEGLARDLDEDLAEFAEALALLVYFAPVELRAYLQ